MADRQDKISLLKQRLNQIAEAIKQHPQGLGLIGLGSCAAQARMDEFSDLDFFVLVDEGAKHRFVQDLHWLSAIHPISYHFRNTADGYKLLYADGVFCEFAIFELHEVDKIPFAAGRFVWRDASVPQQLATPALATPHVSRDENFLLGELLTNLYVGLCRYHRGELCSAMRFIQVYALDRLVSLLDLKLQPDQLSDRDAFGLDRRAEQRHMAHADLLKSCLQGVDNLAESANAILAFIEQHYAVNTAMRNAIRKLL